MRRQLWLSKAGAAFQRWMLSEAENGPRCDPNSTEVRVVGAVDSG